MTRFAQVSFVALALVFASACSSSSSGDAPTAVAAEAQMALNGELGTDPYVEEHEEGSVAWRIDPDGQVKAAISTSAGARVNSNIGGSLVYKVEGGEPRTVPLVADAKTGLLVAAGPKLEADLTEVSYTVTVSGKPWSGVMHVPVGGTTALVASGKAAAEAKVPDEAVGPHGGTIQVVGNDRLEMVADADTGDTRVYVLDASLQPVRVETRTLRMGFVAQQTVFVNFAPEPSGFFFTARLAPAVVVNPFRVTTVLAVGGVTHAAIWGYRPGVRIYSPSAIVKVAAAPRVRFALKGGFDGGFDVYGRAHTKVVARADDDDKKGNNGRQTGKDGTWDRDSGGSKDDGKADPRGGKAKDAHDAKGGGHDAKGGGHDAKGGGHDAKGGGHDAKGGGHDAKGGGSSKSSGNDAKGGGSSKSSGGSGGGSKSGGGGSKSGGGKGDKK
jgi:hypothetical protein